MSLKIGNKINTSFGTVITDISIVILTSIGGSIMWQVCKDLYIYQIYKKRIIRKDMINLNFGCFLGFSLGISYEYTGQPFIYNFIDKNHLR